MAARPDDIRAERLREYEASYEMARVVSNDPAWLAEIAVWNEELDPDAPLLTKDEFLAETEQYE